MKRRCVEEARLRHHLGRAGMDVLGAFALDKDRIGHMAQNGLHRQHVGPAGVQKVPHERLVGRFALVPPAIERGEQGAHEDFVDRGPVVDVGVTAGEGPGIFRKGLGKLPVLEVPQPVGQAKMTKVDDGPNSQSPHLSDHGIHPVPIVFARAKKRFVIRRPPAQVLNVELFDEAQVLPPKAIVTALFHFIYADICGGGLGAATASCGVRLLVSQLWDNCSRYPWRT